MSSLIDLPGLNGATPLGFMASVGLLLVVDQARLSERPRLAWTYRGSWIATLTVDCNLDDLVNCVLADRSDQAVRRVLEIQYPKVEKNGIKSFSGLRPPVGLLRAWLHEFLDPVDKAALDYFAGLMCETAGEVIPEDKRINSEHAGVPAQFLSGDSLSRSVAQTAFDFTSKNQQFINQAQIISKTLTFEEVRKELLGTSNGTAIDRTMGWDAREDKPGALFGSSIPLRYPALEWLAFRSLPLFPLTGNGGLASTTSCNGRRKSGEFRWCVWTAPASLPTVRSLIQQIRTATTNTESSISLSISEVFESKLTKGSDGYSGVFAPVSVV